MVPIPLQHRNQSLGSPTQSCMQGYYWVPLFHPLLHTPSWGPTPSSKANSRTSGPLLLRTCSASSPRLLHPLCPGNKKRSLLTKKETLLEIILFLGHTTTPIPKWDSDHVPPLSPHELQPTSLFPPSFPTEQATVQPDSSLLLANYPPSPRLISKYGLTDLSPPFLVPVVLECMSRAPNATHPIPCLFPLVQLSPASQLKPLPSSKVSIGVVAIWWPANSSPSFS